MKWVIGYEGLYKVSVGGEFFSVPKKTHTRSEKKLTPNIYPSGYAGVTLYKNGKPRTFRASRLVAQTYIPNPLNLPQVNHINGNKLDNRVENLEWCTAKRNIAHAFENGLVADRKGENNNGSKFTKKQILEVKRLGSMGVDYKIIAKQFKMSPQHAWDVVNGRRWAHV